MSRAGQRDGKLATALPRSASSETDAELFAAIRAGNLSALGVLYDRHHPVIRRFVVRATAGDADAEDIVQEVFILAGRAADRYDQRPDARPFLFGIAANMIRSRRQKRQRWRHAFAVLEGSLSGVFRPTPEDGASTSQQMRLLNASLARLSAEKRLVLVMIELEGLSGEEVAGALDLPLGTVWTRLHYARAELREHLKRRTS